MREGRGLDWACRHGAKISEGRDFAKPMKHQTGTVSIDRYSLVLAGRSLLELHRRPVMPQKLAKHWTSIGYFRPIFDYLRAAGQPRAPYLKLLGLSEADLSNPDVRIDNSLLHPLFQMAERECGDPNIGLHAGLTMQVQHIGIVGLLAMSCQYAREIFELHARYQSLIGDGFVFNYYLIDDAFCVDAAVATGHPPLGRQEYEYSLAGLYRLQSQLIGGDSAFQRIELPFERPPAGSAIESLLDAPVSYGHDRIRIFLAKSVYDAELLGADPHIKQLLETQAHQRLLQLRGEQASSDPMLARIRELIAERLAYGTASLESIADAMQVSVRTLQRQLDQHDTRFTQLLDDTRQDLARRYISNAELSLLEIAMMLGFAEQSSFNRAFKRWFGESPGAYRRNS